MERTAVILFNLGGPDRLDSVQPFLFNLFYDPAILSLPNPLRFMVARWIASKRQETAKEIYQALGGKSPLLKNTQAQAQALGKVLGDDYKVFVCMRYWAPRAEQVILEVKNYDPSRMILLPLYPQFSTTTTQSSFKEWGELCRRFNVQIPTFSFCCYPTLKGFIQAMTTLLKKEINDLPVRKKYRVLFTAHGLPERIIKRGDPYQKHVEKTVEEIVKKLDQPLLDYRICYQSRVGALPWIKPYTKDEIIKAGEEKKGLVVVPVSFVSEHSETLVELDEEYRKVAEEKGVPFYKRVPTVSVHSSFIKGLADLVRQPSFSSPAESTLCKGEGCHAAMAR
jgi:ferrochelatase